MESVAERFIAEQKIVKFKTANQFINAYAKLQSSIAKHLARYKHKYIDGYYIEKRLDKFESKHGINNALICDVYSWEERKNILSFKDSDSYLDGMFGSEMDTLIKEYEREYCG